MTEHANPTPGPSSMTEHANPTPGPSSMTEHANPTPGPSSMIEADENDEECIGAGATRRYPQVESTNQNMFREFVQLHTKNACPP